MTPYAGSELVERAMQIAVNAHAGQKDKADEPYIFHPMRVASLIKGLNLGAVYQAVAWLHDVVEDTPVTFDDLREAGMPESVVEAVDAISRRTEPTLEKYRAEYLPRVKANKIARIVKLFDLNDNLSPDRLAKLPHQGLESLRERYIEAQKYLQEGE